MRSNEGNEIGFLSHRGRINVAMTRARKMCILVCDSGTLKRAKEGDGLVGRMVEYFKENGCVFREGRELKAAFGRVL